MQDASMPLQEAGASLGMTAIASSASNAGGMQEKVAQVAGSRQRGQSLRKVSIQGSPERLHKAGALLKPFRFASRNA